MPKSVSGNIKLENIFDRPKVFAEQEEKGITDWDKTLELLDNDTLNRLYEYFDQNTGLMPVCISLIRETTKKRNFKLYFQDDWTATATAKVSFIVYTWLE